LPPAEGLGRSDDCAVVELFDLEGVSFRRAIRRSNSDSREDRVDSGRLDEKVRCPILALSTGGATLVPLLAPIRLPIFGREASRGSGKVLLENKLDRWEPMLDPKLREVGGFGVMLGEGVRLAGGLEDGRKAEEEREKDGGFTLEKDGRLGWLELVDGRDQFRLMDELDRLELIDGPGLLENDCCIREARLAARLRPKVCPELAEDAPPRLAPPDLSRPRAWPPTIGMISTAAVTAATAARDRIVLFFNILLLLPSCVGPRETPDAYDIAHDGTAMRLS
jgi:hypothetical protein